MENQEAYQRARHRVEAKIGFFIHLTVFIVINLLLIIINLITSAGHIWFKWPLIGWGIGLIFHAVGVFFSTEGIKIKERLIAKEIKKEAEKK
jgi:hypothetical protein